MTPSMSDYDKDILAELSSRNIISNLTKEWVSARDSGQWDRLRSTFTQDGVISVSWFHGRHADFVAASQARFGRSFSRHIISGQQIFLGRERAWAESSVMLIGHGEVSGKKGSWTSHFRFIDLLLKGHEGWRVRERSAIYDSDQMVSDEPDNPVEYNQEILNSFPREYRFLAYRLTAQKLYVSRELPTFGSMKEQELKARARSWVSQ